MRGRMSKPNVKGIVLNPSGFTNMDIFNNIDMTPPMGTHIQNGGLSVLNDMAKREVSEQSKRPTDVSQFISRPKK
jgi:hypothetical protein